MTYVVKRAVSTPRPRKYVDSDDMRQTYNQTVTVYPDDDETVYIGLVNASGDAIHRHVKQPAGFVRHRD